MYDILNSTGTVFPDSVMLSKDMSSYNLDLSCKLFIKGDEGLPTVMKCLSAPSCPSLYPSLASFSCDDDSCSLFF